MTDETIAKLKLVGEDGNAFAILGRAKKAAFVAGWSSTKWEEFKAKATAGDYDVLLATCMEYFDVDDYEESESGDEDE